MRGLHLQILWIDKDVIVGVCLAANLVGQELGMDDGLLGADACLSEYLGGGQCPHVDGAIGADLDAARECEMAFGSAIDLHGEPSAHRRETVVDDEYM